MCCAALRGTAPRAAELRLALGIPAQLRELTVIESGGNGVVSGGDRGSYCRVGDAVWRQAAEFEEHLFQAARDHEGEEPAAVGTCGDVVPGSAGNEDV